MTNTKIKLLSNNVKNINKKDYYTSYNTEFLTKSGKYVLYGKDNMLPFHLIELFKSSPTNSSAVSTLHQFLCGEGLNKKVKNKTFGEISFYEMFKKIMLDYALFGGFAIRILSDGRLQHIDFSTVRSGKKNDLGIVDYYYISNNWAKSSTPENIEIANYFSDVKSAYGKLYYFKEYTPNNEYYPLPKYYAGIEAIVSEAETLSYLRATLANSYTPRNVFKFKQDFTPEDENMLLYKMMEQYEGVENAGKPLILTNMQDETSVSIEKLDTQILDPSYQVINETVIEKILAVHKLPRVLATLNSPTGFSNTGEEVRVAFDVYNNKEVKNTQNQIVELLIELTGTKFEVLPLELIKTQLSETALLQVLTQDEIREQYGYEPLAQTDIVDNSPQQDSNI